jgi:hypothetical protein
MGTGQRFSASIVFLKNLVTMMKEEDGDFIYVRPVLIKKMISAIMFLYEAINVLSFPSPILLPTRL